MCIWGTHLHFILASRPDPLIKGLFIIIEYKPNSFLPKFVNIVT